jgi:RNA polymerase sigma factor (sigma-70 family)
MTKQTKMDERELLAQAQSGNKRAITALIEKYTPLVHKMVNKYAFMSPAHSKEDLVQEGRLGIVKAVETFDMNYLTKDGKPIKFMTWVFPKVRAAVQKVARHEHITPKYMLSLEQSDWAGNLEDPHAFEVRDEFKEGFIRTILIDGCDSLDSVRAQIVCDRFGLLGRESLRQGEVAKKHGLTKQSVNGHISRFSKKIREKYPELKEFV